MVYDIWMVSGMYIIVLFFLDSFFRDCSKDSKVLLCLVWQVFYAQSHFLGQIVQLRREELLYHQDPRCCVERHARRATLVCVYIYSFPSVSEAVPNFCW